MTIPPSNSQEAHAAELFAQRTIYLRKVFDCYAMATFDFVLDEDGRPLYLERLTSGVCPTFFKTVQSALVAQTIIDIAALLDPKEQGSPKKPKTNLSLARVYDDAKPHLSPDEIRDIEEVLRYINIHQNAVIKVRQKQTAHIDYMVAVTHLDLDLPQVHEINGVVGALVRIGYILSTHYDCTPSVIPNPPISEEVQNLLGVVRRGLDVPA